MDRWVARRRRARGFTLLELIVVIVILAVLAAIGVVGYDRFQERAQAARVRANLHQIAVATVAQATSTGATSLTREQVKASLASSDQQVTDTVSAAGPLTLLSATTAPAGPGQVSLAFDNGDGTPASDTSGTRLWLASATPSGVVYTQLVTYSGLGCTTAWPAGTPAGAARSCTSAAATPSTPTTVSGWPIDLPTDCTVTSVQQPANGTTSVNGDGTVRYVSNDTFVGTDTVTFQTSCGTKTVTVTVDPLVSCANDVPGGSTWVPAGSGTSSDCPADSVGETPTPPSDGSGLVAVPTAQMTVTALASYPHSSLVYPHVVYATLSGGGLIWVQDTGNTGTTNPSGQAGCAGGTPTCRWGWLSPSGTYSNPSAALTGQGPGHGTIPARFTIDSMFVADDNGIWVSRVNAFVRGTAPVKVVDKSAYTGKVVSLTGYSCFSGTSPVAGNCLWFVTDAGYLGQVNVDTGAVSATQMSVPSTGNGWWSTPTFVSAQSDGSGPYLLVGDEYGNVATFHTDGSLRASSFATPGLAGATYASVDGKVAVGTSSATVQLVSPPTGGTWTPAAGTGVAGVPTALHWHGVPGQMYLATTAPGPCVYRLGTSGGDTYALWCDSRLPTTMPQMLQADPAQLSDDFGYRMSISGDTLVVGADTTNSSVGAAYIYNKVNGVWQLRKTVMDPSGGTSNLGQSVTTNGSTVVISGSSVGCFDNFVVGCESWLDGALVYTRSGNDWNLTSVLTNDATWAFYGNSVALRGTTLFLGSPGDVQDTSRPWGSQYQGAVYVMSQSGSTFTQVARLVAPDDLWGSSATNGAFGGFVSASDDGSELVTTSSYARSHAGVAYVFTGSGATWTAATVENPDPTNVSYFGITAAIDGTTLAVGAQYAPAGSYVQVLTRTGSTWSKVAAFDGVQNTSWVGDTLAVHGNTMVIGNWGDYNDALQDEGSATVLSRASGTWQVVDRVWEPNPTYAGGFGTAVAFDGDTVVVSDYSRYSASGDHSHFGVVFSYPWPH